MLGSIALNLISEYLAREKNLRNSTNEDMDIYV